MRQLIRKTRTLTDKPFGVGVVLAFPHEENVRAILEEKVAVLLVYWGECSEDLVLQAHQSGVKIVPQVSFLTHLPANKYHSLVIFICASYFLPHGTSKILACMYWKVF